MKLVQGNGKILTVRDVGPVLLRLEAAGVPIKYHSCRVVDDQEARDIVKRQLETRLYKKVATH